MKKRSGFTLIELLLVLAIIGIISAIAIPALLSQRARARDKATIQNMVGTFGDVAGAYDRARENALVVVAEMTNVLTSANATGARNPWEPTQPAYTASLVAATVLGEAGFVYIAPVPGTPGSLTGNALVRNQISGSTGSGPYSVSKVSSLE